MQHGASVVCPSGFQQQFQYLSCVLLISTMIIKQWIRKDVEAST